MTNKIIALYQVDPEFRIYQVLKELLQGLELKERGIDTKNIVMQGHPLFEFEAKGTKANDTVFPRIGVDWMNDSFENEYLGENYCLANLSLQREKDFITGYKYRGGSIVDIANDNLEIKEESNYEQVSFHQFDDLLTYNGFAQKFILQNNSLVQITGWSSGATARKSNQWLFMALKSVLPFLAHQLKSKFKVNLTKVGTPETNIINQDIAHNLHGFELKLNVSQLISMYRLLPLYVAPKNPDIYANNSKSKIVGN